MKKKQMHKEQALMSLMILLLMSMIVLSLSQQQNNGDVIDFLKFNPLFILVLLIPIVFWFVFLIKGNAKEALLSFAKRDLIKYVSKFISVIIASYLAYFVLIPHTQSGLIDAAISLFLIFLAFVLFLLASWFEDIKFKELDRSIFKKIKDYTLKPLLFTVIIGGGIFSINYFIISFNELTSFLLAMIYFNGILMSLSPAIKGKIKRPVISSITILTLTIMSFLGIYLYSSNYSLVTNLIYSGVFLLSSIVLLIISIIHDSSEWLRKFRKDLFYEIDE
ncbi:hypothetical protein HNV12_01815 [Methanococcoides sp. SA1]|nr:hypothetical protein [Methanococcoides sp. SA1]